MTKSTSETYEPEFGLHQLAEEHLKALHSLGNDSELLILNYLKKIIATECTEINDAAIEEFQLIARNTHTQEPKKAGIYLRLLHGRTPYNRDMENWGDDGPWIGPISWIHFTYNDYFSIGFQEGCDYLSGSAEKIPPSPLYFFNDCIYCNGIHYGQWEVVQIERKEGQ